MRAFLMCAVLAAAALTVGTTSLQAHEYHHGHYYYGRPPVIVLRPAPVFVAPAPILVTQPVIVTPGYAPATVIVQPVFRPLISLRFGR